MSPDEKSIEAALGLDEIGKNFDEKMKLGQ